MADSFLGHFLVANGYITGSQLQEALSYLHRLNRKIGRMAVEKGFLTPDQVELILEQQLSEDVLFAELGERLGLLTARQARKLVSLQKDRHLHLGEALVALGHLSESEYSEALPVFLARENGRENLKRSLLESRTAFPWLKEFVIALEKSFFRVFRQPLKLEGVDSTPGSLQTASAAALLSRQTGEKVVCILELSNSPVAEAFENVPQTGSHQDLARSLAEVMLQYLNNAMSESGESMNWELASPERPAFQGDRLKFAGLTLDVVMSAGLEEDG